MKELDTLAQLASQGLVTTEATETGDSELILLEVDSLPGAAQFVVGMFLEWGTPPKRVVVEFVGDHTIGVRVFGGSR